MIHNYSSYWQCTLPTGFGWTSTSFVEHRRVLMAKHNNEQKLIFEKEVHVDIHRHFNMEKERNWCLKKCFFAAFLVLLLFLCFTLKTKTTQQIVHSFDEVGFRQILSSVAVVYICNTIRPLYTVSHSHYSSCGHFLSVALCTHDTTHDVLCLRIHVWIHCVYVCVCVCACLFDSLSDAADLSMLERYHSYNIIYTRVI